MIFKEGVYMFRKIYSHLWIIAFVSFIIYCIIASVIEYGIVEIGKVLMVIVLVCVIASSFIMWLLSLYDDNDDETSGYQPKGGNKNKNKKA